MKFLGIIPARYYSTRLPRKPLLLIGDKTMIQRVYEQALLVLEDVVVATDHEEIYNCVLEFGGHAVMTSPLHRSGTDRCVEALDLFSKQQNCTYDVVINIQGDEPFMQPSQIQSLMDCFLQESTQIATLIKPFDREKDTYADLENENTPKVVCNLKGEAIMFSRSVIPYVRDIDTEGWLRIYPFHKHIGIYAYRSSVLKELTLLFPSDLEGAESLEQLRWIENGYRIQTAITHEKGFGIDTHSDLERARAFVKLQQTNT